MKKLTLLLLLAVPLLEGCSVVSNNRVFPKVTWYWSADAAQQRRDKAEERKALEQWKAKAAREDSRPTANGPT